MSKRYLKEKINNFVVEKEVKRKGCTLFLVDQPLPLGETAQKKMALSCV